MITLPSNSEDELGIIGCCLAGGLDTAIEAVQSVPSGAFFREDCREAFKIIEVMATNAASIDSVTFAKTFHTINKAMPSTAVLTADVPSAHNLSYYVHGVIEAHRKRRLAWASHQVLSRIETESADTLTGELESACDAEELKTVTIHDSKDSARLLIDDLEWRYNLNGKRSGLSTGFVDFDNMLDGLQLGEMTVIGARPSIGKTAIAINFLQRICFQEKIPSLFVSLEMSTKAIMRRVFSASHDVSMNSIKRGQFTERELLAAGRFAAASRETPHYFIEAVGGLDINRLCSNARGLCRRHQIKLIIVDYLQKVKPSRHLEKRTYEVAEVSSALKALAVATNTAVVALAQVNRESEKSKSGIPHMSDLGDSGQIERDADVVALLHRDKSDPENKATLFVAKQRDGETGAVDLTFNGAYCRFESTDPHR